MRLLLLPLLLVAPLAGASAAERIAVLAVHDPPAPDGELTELAHQLRAASMERSAGVLTAPEMRDRLAGKSGGATVQELDRAFGGALAVYQNGEFESAARTLRAIVDDLEDLPESDAVWSQWTRAMMRLSHVYLSMKQPDEVEAVQTGLLKVDSTHQLDPVLYAPGFRARFEEVRQRVRAMPKRRLTVTARGRAGTIYVGGRDIGPTPATVILPAGSYRVAGAAGALRIPSFTVDLAAEDKAVVLDFALAETFRPGAGPGMVLPASERAPAIIRAGAWLGVDRLVVASRASEGGAQFLVGAIYDVRRGALLREGSVRMVSGSVPAANLGALSSFLLTGQSSRDVLDRSREPQSSRAARSPVAAPQAAPPAAPATAAPVVTAQAQAPQVVFIPAVAQVAKAPPTPGPASEASKGAALTVAAPPAAIVVTAPPANTITNAPPPAQAPAPTANVTAAPAPPPTPTGTATPAAPRTAKPPDPAPARGRAAATSAATPAPPPQLPPEPAAAPPPAKEPDLHATPPVEDPVARALRAVGPSAEEAPYQPPAWRRPALIGAGVVATLLGCLSVQQGLAARSAYRDADAMILPGGYFQPGYTPADYQGALDRGDAAKRNAWLAGSGAVISAAAGLTLHWLSRDHTPAR